MAQPTHRISSARDQAQAEISELSTSEGVSDAELARRALAGDRWAEEALYRRHVRYVGGMVTRLLRGSSEAEDVLQETFVLAFQRLGQLREPERFRPWLAQVAVSLVHRRFRRQRVLRFVTLGAASDEGSRDLESLIAPDAPAEVRAELGTIGRALAKMPAAHQIAWMLRYVEDESLEDVARICDCSLATAKRRIAAAMERIQAHLAPERG